VRQGEPGFLLSVPGSSARYPTEGCAIHDVPAVIQVDPAIWPRASEFVPERWMVTDPENPLRPVKDAWRPFSMGARNCIGLELAMVEIKLVAAVEAWEEWDRLRGKKGPKEMVDGERLYGVGKTMLHPKDGMPVQVRRAKR
jgi:cytochrome P450